MPMIDAVIHDAVMALPPDERRDRAKVNEAVRDGLRLGPLRRAGAEGDGVVYRSPLKLKRLLRWLATSAE
jgi:hypothetical protein